jgi:hypothetical protein
MGTPAVFHFRRQWTVPLSPEQLWAQLEVPNRYCQWWDWLERFDGDDFHVGADLPLVIRSPLWYHLRTVLHVDELEPAHHLHAQVTGDLIGPASLEIYDEPTGSRAEIAWDLRVNRPDLRLAARLGRPALVWAHDQIANSALADFEAKVCAAG